MIIITAKAGTKVISKTVKSDQQMADWIKIQSLKFGKMGIPEDQVEFVFINLR